MLRWHSNQLYNLEVRNCKQMSIRRVLVPGTLLKAVLGINVISHDLHRCRALIVDRCSTIRLHVNTSLIEPFEACTNSLYQFIGDVESRHADSGVAERCLKAISYRCVDGLDLVKYYHAVDARCSYLQQRDNNCSSN